jgi:hypothetical protein
MIPAYRTTPQSSAERVTSAVKDRQRAGVALCASAEIARRPDVFPVDGIGERPQTDNPYRTPIIGPQEFLMQMMLCGMATVLATFGQAEQAAEVAGYVLRIVYRFDDLNDLDLLSGVEVLSKVAAVLAGAGQHEQAAEAAWQVLRTLVGIDEPEEQATVLSDVVLAEAGQAEQALQAVAGINDPQQRARALAALLSNSVASSNDREVGRRALELLLYTPDAAEHLAAFPPALLSRLVANGELSIRPQSRPPLLDSLLPMGF